MAGAFPAEKPTIGVSDRYTGRRNRLIPAGTAFDRLCIFASVAVTADDASMPGSVAEVTHNGI